MEETQNQESVSMTPKRVSEAQETTPEKKSNGPLIAAGVVIVLILIGAWYMLERQGTIQTGVFVAGDAIAPNAVVATVNGTDIIGQDLVTSVGQITATAQLQGIDVTDPNVQADIRIQAVEMLVNTELLEQEAINRGISISDTEVEDRITLLVAEVGDEQLLEERMLSLGIDDETLREDVKSELMIQALLDEIFLEEGIEVTEDEVLAFYESATGGGEDAPAFEEISDQLEAQIRATKEQEIIDGFISELRAGAAVTVTE